jgi:hypothetical protein
MHPREVARLLTVREWLCLCDQVDGTFGKGRKFDVLRVDRNEKLEVTVSVEGVAGSAMYSMRRAAA